MTAPRSKILVALVLALAGCDTTMPRDPGRGATSTQDSDPWRVEGSATVGPTRGCLPGPYTTCP